MNKAQPTVGLLAQHLRPERWPGNQDSRSERSKPPRQIKHRQIPQDKRLGIARTPNVRAGSKVEIVVLSLYPKQSRRGFTCAARQQLLSRREIGRITMSRRDLEKFVRGDSSAVGETVETMVSRQTGPRQPPMVLKSAPIIEPSPAAHDYGFTQYAYVAVRKSETGPPAGGSGDDIGRRRSTNSGICACGGRER